MSDASHKHVTLLHPFVFFDQARTMIVVSNLALLLPTRRSRRKTQ
jgi:hypothetical protein